MKTTVEIADTLLRAAKQRAARDGTTLRALIEDGLRTVLSDEPRPFILPDASVGGLGLASRYSDGGWDRVRDTIYEERGG